MRQSLEMVLGASSEKELRALLESKLLLKQLTCEEELEKSMWVIQRTTILDGGIQSDIRLLKTEATAEGDDHAKKKKKKKKKGKAASAAQPDSLESSQVLELLCRSIYNKEDTLDGLRVHIDAFIASTPDEVRFIDSLNTVMGNYIKDTANFVEMEMRPKLLTEATRSQRLCRFMVKRLQEYFEGIIESCEQIETIVTLYFAKHKKNVKNYQQHSPYLEPGLSRLVISKLIDNCPQVKDFIVQSASVEGITPDDSFNYLQQILEIHQDWSKSKPKPQRSDPKSSKTQEQQEREVLEQIAKISLPSCRLQCEFDAAWIKSIQSSFQKTSKRKK